ncbi:MAG TPA: lasso RiPP family leader peptide-containing protein [Acidimicrobiales bacterium]|nr:lasso RiPP family leader peptide-containing protein [Acidimicrobiales bacterium]
MDDAKNLSHDGYEAPALIEYGSIEEWTKGQYAELINLSLVTP